MERYYLWAFVSVGNNSSETCRADTSRPVWPPLDPRHRHAGDHVVSRNHDSTVRIDNARVIYERALFAIGFVVLLWAVVLHSSIFLSFSFFIIIIGEY